MPLGIYHVWHLKAEVSIESQESERPVHFPADYEHVARVRAKTLDEVYEKTNSLDGPWWARADVRCVKPSRSTSIDDVVVGPEGSVHVLGWKGWAMVREAREQAAEQKPSIEPAR
jgi:hypothetical protein